MLPAGHVFETTGIEELREGKHKDKKEKRRRRVRKNERKKEKEKEHEWQKKIVQVSLVIRDRYVLSFWTLNPEFADKKSIFDLNMSF